MKSQTASIQIEVSVTQYALILQSFQKLSFDQMHPYDCVNTSNPISIFPNALPLVSRERVQESE